MDSDRDPDSVDKSTDESVEGGANSETTGAEIDVVEVESGDGVAEVAHVSLVDPEALEAVQAENAELRKQLVAQQAAKSRPRSTANPLWRRIVVGVLVVLAVVALVASVSAAWVKTTIQDEDEFVATLEPLPQEETVATVISNRVASEILDASGVEVWLSEQLPAGLGFLAVPVTDSIRQVIADVSLEFVMSDAFRSVWSTALRATHRAASAVISGNGGVLESEGGVVSINLDEIAGMVVDRVESTGLELPDADVEFGSIVLYEDRQLAAVQSLMQTIDTLGWFLPLLALVFIAAAIWLSRDRRRTTAYVGFGTAIGLIASLIALRFGRNYVVNAIEDVTRRQAAGDAWDLVLVRLYQMMWAALILALIVGIVAWVMGPSRRAVEARAWGSGTIRRWRQPAQDRPSEFTSFIADWKQTIQVLAVAVGLMFVLFGPPPTGFSVLLTAVIVLGVVVVAEVLAVPKPSETAEAQGPVRADADEAGRD